MKDKIAKQETDDLRFENDVDYSKAIREKYYRRLLEEGSNVIILDPDVAKTFHDSPSVSEALRSLLELTRSTNACHPQGVPPDRPENRPPGELSAIAFTRKS